MTSFLDGPAKGQHLMLKRAARFLRVVCADGKWDGLDQPDDRPAANELIFAYAIARNPGACHIRASGGRGGFYPIAEYHMVAIQPDDRTLRDTDLWCQWCEAQPKPPLAW